MKTTNINSRLICSLIFSIFCVFNTLPVYAQDSSDIQASSLTKSSVFSIDGSNADTRALVDEQISTRYKLKNKQTIKIQSNEPIASLYVLFNKPPKQWEIRYDQQQSPCGKYGFMHELIELQTPQTTIELNFEKDTELH